MPIYKKKRAIRRKTLSDGSTESRGVPVAFPSIELEEDNEVYFAGLEASNFFLPGEIDLIKKVRSREQFEDYCRSKEIAFQTNLI